MGRFKDKYRIESTRLQGWDYAQPAAYFVTICTRDRLPFFGRIDDCQMKLTPAGMIVAEEWQRTAALRDSVELDSWVVMPNHLHGIIGLTGDSREPFEARPSERWRPDSIGSIVNQFKGVCTKRIRRETDPCFGWQSRFYEHIVRDDDSMDRIRAYIAGNPASWAKDQLFITGEPYIT